MQKNLRIRTLPPFQLYAGAKYASSDVHKIKPGAAVVHARHFEGSMMDAGMGRDGKLRVDQSGRLRRVYPFTMSPDAAMTAVLQWIRGQVEEEAKSQAKQAYPMATDVAEVELTVMPLPGFSAHPVYVPAHIFTLRSPLFQLKMRTFVGAFPGAPTSGI